MVEPVPPTRIRDPARKERILAAAADLVARSGYHAVSMADMGAAAGITGSGIYRHFEGKSAVLVALFDRVIDHLLDDERAIVQEITDLREALKRLVRGQVEFVITTVSSPRSTTTRSTTCPKKTAAGCAANSGSTSKNGCTCSTSSATTSATPRPAPSCTPPSVPSSPPCSTTPGSRTTGSAHC